MVNIRQMLKQNKPTNPKRKAIEKQFDIGIKFLTH